MQTGVEATVKLESKSPFQKPGTWILSLPPEGIEFLVVMVNVNLERVETGPVVDIAHEEKVADKKLIAPYPLAGL